jgi:hypothetical protein
MGLVNDTILGTGELLWVDMKRNTLGTVQGL